MNNLSSNQVFSESGGELEDTLSVEHQTEPNSDEVENWFPEPVSRLLNTKDLQVLSLDQIDSIKAENDIGYSQGFGLRVITDKKCSPDGKKHWLVCITTIENIYVLRPTVYSDVQFLRCQLQRKDIDQRRVYVWEGTQIGYYLRRYMNIILEHQTDLYSLDLNLTFEQHIGEHLNQSGFLTSYYVDNVIKPKKKTFNQLAYEWLSIEPNLLQSHKLDHSEIGQFPLSPRACNLIKKRCSLVRHVGEVMMSVFERRRSAPLKLIYGMAHRSNSDIESFRNSNQEYADLM